jgi:hypothetical protein
MCDVFAQPNYNRTQAKELVGLAAVVSNTKAEGMTHGGIGLASAFGSNWTGEFSHEQHMLEWTVNTGSGTRPGSPSSG